MSNQRYTPEFKDEAARQIVDRGYSVADATVTLVASVLRPLKRPHFEGPACLQYRGKSIGSTAAPRRFITWAAGFGQ